MKPAARGSPRHATGAAADYRQIKAVSTLFGAYCLPACAQPSCTPPPFADTVPPPSRLIIIPDMLKNAPMFKKVQTLRKQAAGGGKGKGKGKDAAKK